MDRIYTDQEGEYFAKNPSWHTEDSRWKAGQILKMIRRNDLKPSFVVEVGCGAGEILHNMADLMTEDVRFVGYEISPDAFAMCRPTDRIQYKLGDINQDDNKADLLLMIDVFEHVEDYLSFLRSCKSKASYKIFHIPLDLSVISLMRNQLMTARNNVGHIHYFSKETALASLKDTGYEVIDFFYTPVSVELSRTLKSKIIKIPRQVLFTFSKDRAVKLLGGYSLMVLAR